MHITSVEFTGMVEKEYFQEGNTRRQMLEITPENFVKKLKEWIESHPDGIEAAKRELSNKSGVSSRQIQNYRSGQQEPTITPMRSILLAMGRRPYMPPDE